MSEHGSEEAASTAAHADVLETTEAGGKIIRGGAIRLGSYVLSVGLSVLAASLLTRHLGVVRFGEYTTVLSLVSVLAAITDAGMSTLGLREFAVREGIERAELVRDLLGLRMVLTLVGVALVVVFGLSAGYRSALLLGAVLASLGTVALVVQHTYTIALSADLRLGTLSALDLARQVLSVGAIVALVVADAGLLPFLAVPLAVNVALIAPTARLARNQVSARLSLRPRRWGMLLRLTMSFSLAAAVGTTYVFTAQILTSLVSTPHESGLFAAAFRVFIVLGAVPGLLVGGALPLLARSARDDNERLAYSLQRIFEVSLILGVGAFLGTLGGAKFMIDVVAGHEYAAAAGVLQIMGGALIASFLLAGWSYALLSLSLYRGVLLTNLAAFIVSFGLTIVLAHSHGASGAATATLCGESVLALGSLYVLLRSRPYLRPELAIVAKVVLAAAPAAVLAVVPDAPSLLRALLALGAYALLIVIVRALPAELTALLGARGAGEP